MSGKHYMVLTTGVIWTEEEIRAEFENFRYEMNPQYDSFEEYMEEMLRLGHEKVGGYEEVEKMYIVIDEQRNGEGDVFTEEFVSKLQAINKAANDWHYLSAKEKEARRIYVLESINPDVDAENHFDGNIVWDADKDENTIEE